MKYRKFLGVSRTTQQAYFKLGVELLYPSMDRAIRIAVLPAYDPRTPDPTGWLPAIGADEENDFYCVVRAAKFVGHGNRRARVSFLSPNTFDPDADDPYAAFYDYCSMSDRWSYLTKDKRGKSLTGEVEGAIFPREKNFFVANVVELTRDLKIDSRGGVYVTELPETVMKGLVYNMRKDGTRVDGIALQKDDAGNLVYGDITNPRRALGLEIAFGDKGYVVRPLTDRDGNLVYVEIPDTLLQHRRHMEEPGTFLVQPEDPQTVVDRLAGLLRGYKSPDGYDELDALREAIEFAYGKGAYSVPENASDKSENKEDPFADAAQQTVSSDAGQKAEAVEKAVQRGVDKEKYTPVSGTQQTKKPAPTKAKPKTEQKAHEPVESAPGENIDPSDIAAMRDLLKGGK